MQYAAWTCWPIYHYHKETNLDDYVFTGVCYVVLAYFVYGVVILVRYGFN